ncbi:MAG: hypothetical protein ABIF88_02990 [archaeon]
MKRMFADPSQRRECNVARVERSDLVSFPTAENLAQYVVIENVHSNFYNADNYIRWI